LVNQRSFMPSSRAHPGLGDYLAIAICPLLIMALVSSLVFFLLEVLYAGNYGTRLQWILFLFVFAAVWIARLSITESAGRAALYGVVLGIVVWLALQSFVVYGPDTPLAGFSWAINIALMGIIWWCAHRLTWDCTFIDEEVDSSGAGLLEAAGLEAASGPGAVSPAAAEAPPAPAQEPETTSGLGGWWARYRRYREEVRRKPHAPGVWIVYFSLAALPLFGLGQSLIPAEEEDRRQYVFWLMSIYVASGLGLLLTTSFLGLRRYLRQRKAEMPAPVASVWVLFGGLLIALLLVTGALLPRPNAEYPLVRLPQLAGSEDRSASAHAMKGDSPGKGEGRPGAGQPGQDQNARGGANGKPGGQADGAGKQAGGERPGDGAGKKDGGNNPGEGKGERGAPGDDRNGDNREQRDDEKSTARGRERGDGGGAQQAERQDRKTDARRSDGSPIKPGHYSSGTPQALNSAVRGLLTVLKWVVFGILALVVAFVVIRALVKFLANFTFWSRGLLAILEAWWQRLFGWWQPTAEPAPPPEEPQTRPIVRRPFSWYQNPFTSGQRVSRRPEELIRYSFEALDAWAHERGLGRRGDETPLEFTERLSHEYPALEGDARRLATLYAWAAYARAPLPAQVPTLVRQFWKCLEAVVEAPLSA
jgi:hypothetical protein